MTIFSGHHFNVMKAKALKFKCVPKCYQTKNLVTLKFVNQQVQQGGPASEETETLAR